MERITLDLMSEFSGKSKNRSYGTVWSGGQLVDTLPTTQDSVESIFSALKLLPTDNTSRRTMLQEGVLNDILLLFELQLFRIYFHILYVDKRSGQTLIFFNPHCIRIPKIRKFRIRTVSARAG